MKDFLPYAKQLEGFLLRGNEYKTSQILRQDIAAALDGQPRQEIRRRIPLKLLRETGTFFTSKSLACKLLNATSTPLTQSSVVADPACGVGDLLLAHSRQLPVKNSLRETLSHWNQRLVGRDIHPELARVARLRIALESIRRGVKNHDVLPSELCSLLSNIRAGDGLRSPRLFSFGTHVLLNPPFSSREASDSCSWASGGVSMAAVFIDHCLSHAKDGCAVTAILPDVLRSGVRYEKWRKRIESMAQVKKVRAVGQFDRWTDVDVFLLDTIVKQEGKTGPHVSWKGVSTHVGKTIGEVFSVSVGPVVPFRHPKQGPLRPYIRSGELPAWKVIASAPRNRRFAGATVQPPFVAVRRTSRPGDQFRAIGTIIRGEGNVAVENHLLVLQPKDKTLQRCKDLLSCLRDSRTTQWLDKRIRCRHLTVGALSDIPWWGDEHE